MYKALKFTAFLIALLFLPSCDLLNSFILNVSPSQVCWIEFRNNILPVGEWAYAQIKEVEIWEQGDDRVRLETTIQDTLQIKIDGVYLSDDKYLLSDTFTLPINVLDDKGNLLGTYGEFMNLYFETSFVVGTHIATIELASTTEKNTLTLGILRSLPMSLV
jgi:hypothetical protein